MTTTAWAIKAPDGSYDGIYPMTGNIAYLKSDAIFLFICSFGYETTWKKQYRYGYRCVRVTVTEVQE